MESANDYKYTNSDASAFVNKCLCWKYGLHSLLVSPEDCGEEIFFLMDWEWTWGFVPIRQEHSHWAISPALVLFFLIKYLLNGLSS